MIKREIYLSRIRPFYDSEMVKVITGIRRCGKSTIMRQIIAEIKENGILKALKKSRILRQIDGTLCYNYKLIPIALLNNGILRTYDYSGVLEHMEIIANKED